MKKIKNIHCFMSPMLNESRVMKETSSLIQLKLIDEVRILGYWHKGLDKEEKLDNYRTVLRISTISKKVKIKNIVLRKFLSFISFIELSAKFLIRIIDYKADFISCHNLLLLPVCVIGKKITNAKLVYVPHELETQKTGLSNLLKQISTYIERTFIKDADRIMVVCEPIAKWYRDVYRINNIYVLRNVPFNPFLDKPLVRSRKLRDEFLISNDDVIFIYQGVIDKARGCGELIEVFKKVSPTKHIVMMGYGDMVDAVRMAANNYKNIHFKQAVPVQEIIDYTSSADVGIVYLPFEISLSYKYSMSNKFFEYLIGGLPIALSSNLEYMCNEIQNHNLGWILDLNQSSLVDFVNSLNKELINKILVKNYADKSGWQLEHNILKLVYHF